MGCQGSCAWIIDSWYFYLFNAAGQGIGKKVWTHMGFIGFDLPEVQMYGVRWEWLEPIEPGIKVLHTWLNVQGVQVLKSTNTEPGRESMQMSHCFIHFIWYGWGNVMKKHSWRHILHIIICFCSSVGTILIVKSFLKCCFSDKELKLDWIQ